MRRIAVFLLLTASCTTLLTASCATEQVGARPVDEAVREGVRFLLATQNRDGSWGSAHSHGFDIYAPVPGAFEAFKVATTALCVLALREVAGEEGAAARQRGVDYLLAHTDVRRATADTLYNVWAHIYAVQALSREYAATRDTRLAHAAERHIVSLARYETMYGGWNYYDFTAGTQVPASSGTSFGTGAAVVALEDARRAGIAVPEQMLGRALRLIEKCRKPDGSYIYDYEFRYWPLHLANRDKGSLGRAQAPNCALWLQGRLIEESDVIAALERMFRDRKFLECGRKRQWPHEAYYYNSGYYYYFGHYYAARLIAGLGPEDRRRLAPQLLAGILPFQEPNGAWWDFAMFDYHKQYGTALALLATALVR